MEWNKEIGAIDEVADLERLVVSFDDGTWLPYNSEDWPYAMVTGWILLPELPCEK